MIIQTHPGGAIVPADQELEPVSMGVLDMASQGPGLWKEYFMASPRFTFTVAGPTALQYYFWYMWGDGFPLLHEMLDSKDFNVMGIAAVCREPETFIYTKSAIEKPEDLDGMTIRLMGDEAEIFGNLGVAAVMTPSPEIYESVQRGVLDAFQHSSLAADLPMGFNEIVDYAYVSPVRQATDIYVYIVNRDSWAALPDDLKRIVSGLLWEEGIRHYAEWTYKNTVATPEWIAQGVSVEPCPKSVEDAVTKYATEFYDEQSAADPFYAKVMDSLNAWRDAYAATYPRL
jgi:TRAP-type mannitol/chloroaromatic compound transport system substrate-binding protein